MGAELPRNSFSVAKEGKVFEQKKLLQPLLGTPEGTKMTGTIFFLTSPTLTVYSNTQPMDAARLSFAIRKSVNFFCWFPQKRKKTLQRDTLDLYSVNKEGCFRKQSRGNRVWKRSFKKCTEYNLGEKSRHKFHIIQNLIQMHSSINFHIKAWLKFGLFSGSVQDMICCWFVCFTIIAWIGYHRL